MHFSKFVPIFFWLNLLGTYNSHELKEADTEGRNLTNLYKNNLAQMVHLINHTIDACEDFYRHACADYENSEERTEEPTVPPFLYNKEDRMHFFTQQYPNFQTPSGRVLAQIYDECKQRKMQHTLTHEKPQTHWQRLLYELPWLAQDATLHAGWPYLKHQWLALEERRETNWIEIAAIFAAHGVPTLLHMYFAERTIFIAPVETLNCVSLAEYKRTLIPIVGNVKYASIIARELRDFCRSLRNETPLVVSVNNNSTHNVLIDDNTIAYFQHFFANLNFTEPEFKRARKLPVDVIRVGIVLQLLHETESRVIYNFILWHVHEALRYEDCYLLTEEFERLLHAEYWQWYSFEPYFGRDVAMAMYIYHTTRFQQQRRQQLTRPDWYRFLMAPLERKDFNIVRLLQEHAKQFLNSTQLAEIYDPALLKPGAFYWNLLQMRKQQLRFGFATPIVDNEDPNQAAYFLRKFLHFCILLVHQPLYHYYATQGFDMWLASELLYDTDGYYTTLYCLEQQTLQHQENSTIYSDLSTHQVKDIFNFYRAFVETTRDYRFWLEGESFAFAEDFVLEYFDLDSKRIMFYAVAQLYCHRNDQLFPAQINRSFMNMPNFQEAFNCSEMASMNPTTKCMIRNCE